MTHGEKIDHLLASLPARGVRPGDIAPPLYRLLWRLGWQIRPPLFQGFVTPILTMGIPFGLAFGPLTWLVVRLSGRPFGPEDALVYGATTGAFFGLGMAVYFSWKKRALGLPAWERYPDA